MAHVALFDPCYMAALRPGDAAEATRVLEALGDDVTLIDGRCCGQPGFNSGYRGEAKSVGRSLLRAAQPWSTVVGISGSCTSMVQHYLPTLFDGSRRLGAESIAGRFHEFGQYVATHPNIDRLGLKLDGIVAYHDSCHARRELHVSNDVLALLGRIDGLEVRRLSFEDECCGFGGTFSVKLPEISVAMMTSKLDDVAATGAKVLVSTDFSCLSHLDGGARGLGLKLETWTLAELLFEGARLSAYRERAAKEMREARPGATVTPIMRKLITDSSAMLRRGPDDAKARASAARMYAVDHLEELHAEMQINLERRGIGYHRAATAADAVGIIKRLLGDATRVAKSKSMVGEEVGLTHALREAGIDVLETDIGEYIVDIEGRGPSHITAPALHLNRARIRDMLARTGADLPDDDPTRLSRYVRDVVGKFFEDCDAGITGTNVSIASSGRLGIVENEGNVSLGVSHPKLHIAITGYEKIVKDEAAALAIFEVLAPSATAQPLTSFTHFLADPDPDQQRHVVFVDNGRSRIAKDERYREVLKCIRCGACMNGCPVYRAAGGLSYGSPYMGPIGAVISPLLWRDGRYADLPFASSLCGRCTEVCPVGIPLHRMLLDLRADAVEQGRAGSRLEKAGWIAWAAAFGGATRARAASALGRIGLRNAGRIVRPHGDSADPRMLPEPGAPHDPGLLLMATERRSDLPVIALDDIVPESLPELFEMRARQLGIEVVPKTKKQKGDRTIHAVAGIASTGSVVLTGDDTARRPLLAATRVVVELSRSTIVRYPSDVAPYLGDGNALILTGASRTADIEKQIVKGIHGAEEMVIVLTD